jgi:hypothetical protein
MVAHAETQPILIIEDDQKTANLVSLYLDKEGFKSVVAHDAGESHFKARPDGSGRCAKRDGPWGPFAESGKAQVECRRASGVFDPQ